MTSFTLFQTPPPIDGPGACTCRRAAATAIDALDTAYSHTREDATALDECTALANAAHWQGQAATLMRQSLNTLIVQADTIGQRARIMLANRREDAQ